MDTGVRPGLLHVPYIWLCCAGVRYTHFSVVPCEIHSFFCCTILAVPGILWYHCHKYQRANDPGNKEKLCSGTELLHLKYILFQHLIRALHLLFRTTSRIQTFYDGAPDSPPGVCHIPTEPAYCPSTSQVVSESAKALGLKLHPAVTCITIEGPRFSSLAESKMYRSMGGDVINMTSVPEVTHWICYCWCKENVQWNRITILYPLSGIPSRRGLKTGFVFLGWKCGEALASLSSLEGGSRNQWSGKYKGEKWALNFQQV